jgi:hypothetical protein
MIAICCSDSIGGRSGSSFGCSSHEPAEGSRRAAVAVLATGVPNPGGPGLFHFGRQFDQTAAQIDAGIDHGDVTDQMLDRLGVFEGIVSAPAVRQRKAKVEATVG